MPPAKIALAVLLLSVSAAYAQEPTEPLANWADKNIIDDAADQPDWDARRKFMNRTFRATKHQLADAEPADVCARHRMHKVWYGDKWRCRK